MSGPRDADRPIRTALYAGSFDPLTNGHLDVIRAAVRLCDILIVAVGTHATKQPMLDQATRTALILSESTSVAEASGCRLMVETYSGLSVDAARLFGATVIVRGLRGIADFDDEIAMAGMNAAMAPEVQTIFVPASPGTRFITATLVRQIAAMKGDVSRFVPAKVALALKSAVSTS